MKRSSSVPEITGYPILPAAASASLRTRRGISRSQISLPGDLAKPAPAFCMDDSPRRMPPYSPIPISRLNSPTSRPHRVEQLKKEECIDERPSEKEVMDITNLNQSYEELRVDTIEGMEVWPTHSSPSHQPSFLSPSSPLTKLGAARSRSLTPTSPLPHRQYCRRSCSPVLRPSQLWTGQKRRREESYNDVDMDTSPTSCPPKRFQPYRAVSPTISPPFTPHTGNSPLHHPSRKSSSHSESTPLSSPSSLLAGAGGHLTVNPFAVNYDSGNCDPCQSGSASSSGSQSPLLVITAGAPANLAGSRENGTSRMAEEVRRGISGYPQVGELRNNVNIEPPGPPDPYSEAPTPLSPKGLQFRHRPFPLSSSSLQSPIPRSISTSTMSSTGTPVLPSRSSPLPVPKSSLQHDKYLSPFNSDLPHTHGHAHTHPHSHSNTHRHLHPLRALRAHLSTSSISGNTHRHPAKTSEQTLSDPKSFSNRLSVHSPLSKLATSTSVEEYHCTTAGVNSSLFDGGREGRRERGGRLQEERNGVDQRVRVRRKRKESEASLDDRDESLMESDSSGYDEGVEMTTASRLKQT